MPQHGRCWLLAKVEPDGITYCRECAHYSDAQETAFKHDVHAVAPNSRITFRNLRTAPDFPVEIF